MKVGTSVVFDVLCVSLLALPFTLFQPTYQCYTERAKVAEMMVVASPYRDAITERATQRKSLSGVGEGLRVEPTGRVHGGAISTNGVITLFSNEPRALVVLRPYFENSEVKWACEGFPLKAMTASCRQLPYQTP
ncbi:pilin [Acidovorax sp. Q11]